MKPIKAEIVSIIVTVLFIVAAAVVLLIGGNADRAVTVTMQNAQHEAVSPLDCPSAPPAGTDSEKININTATENELCTLPGIGSSISKSIIAYREANGDFSFIEDIMSVSGIGREKFNDIREYITVR